MVMRALAGVPNLIKLLGDDDADVRLWAAEALGQLNEVCKSYRERSIARAISQIVYKALSGMNMDSRFVTNIFSFSIALDS